MPPSSDNDSSDDEQQQPQPKQKQGLFARIGSGIEMAQQGYEQLVHAIIRPPRADKYTVNQLGPSDFIFLKQRFRREDVELTTKNTTHPSPDNKDDFEPQPLKMKASIWTRVDEDLLADEKKQNDGVDDKKTMVVYLHGNASARLEVLPQLSFLLAQGIFGVASLDFTGSGKSDGDYVSLGYFERYDLETMLQYLQQTYGKLEIVLWGRSMGASTALMHASQKTQEHIWKKEGSTLSISASSEESADETTARNPNGNVMSTTILRGLICDSPFASLPLLCEELVEKARSQGLVVPGVIVGVAIAIIARSVRNRAFFNIHEISPIDHAPTLPIPALFICGADDDFIPPHHSERLIEAYKKGVRTNLFMVPGGHNDPRPELVFEAVHQFLRNELSLTEDMALTVPSTMEKSYFRHPPWAYKRNPDIFQERAEPAVQRQKQIDGATTLVDDATRPEELGMTKERQDDIQNKIHIMLGQVSSSNS
ncbi:alpha/beta fold family hydrolase [Nitzschia inconspicua]|uniref:Alpha/beta fold family hydrolase n=1 Tax=Nitzschia inconspicua TaxID=303405 RepID=A0A9K3LJ96_9STRA|nr:alpha/beta fold family hydrolase [Nitzschia inconspicua]